MIMIESLLRIIEATTHGNIDSSSLNNVLQLNILSCNPFIGISVTYLIIYTSTVLIGNRGRKGKIQMFFFFCSCWNLKTHYQNYTFIREAFRSKSMNEWIKNKNISISISNPSISYMNEWMHACMNEWMNNVYYYTMRTIFVCNSYCQFNTSLFLLHFCSRTRARVCVYCVFLHKKLHTISLWIHWNWNASIVALHTIHTIHTIVT